MESNVSTSFRGTMADLASREKSLSNSRQYICYPAEKALFERVWAIIEVK